jgi:hypothetical protein
VALHRSISVITGVLWALIVSRTWWPSEARRELGVGLSEFLLNLGWLYNRLVMSYSVPPESLIQMAHNEHNLAVPILGSTAALVGDHGGVPDERTGLLGAAITSGINTNIRHFMSMYVTSWKESSRLTPRQGIAFANQVDCSSKPTVTGMNTKLE